MKTFVGIELIPGVDPDKNGATVDITNEIVNEGCVSVPPPLVTNVRPLTGATGTTVTIKGTSFGAPTLKVPRIVTFNGVMAPIVKWSDTKIVVTVPPAATSGNMVVTVDFQTSNSASFTVEQ